MVQMNTDIYKLIVIEQQKYQQLISKKTFRISLSTWFTIFQTESNLYLRSFLHDAVVNSALRIGKFIDKDELYRQCPPIQVKDTRMIEIDNEYCLYSVMKIFPVLEFKREKWVANSIIKN